jgi:hypothetical protein
MNQESKMKNLSKSVLFFSIVLSFSATSLLSGSARAGNEPIAAQQCQECRGTWLQLFTNGFTAFIVYSFASSKIPTLQALNKHASEQAAQAIPAWSTVHNSIWGQADAVRR